MKKVDASTFDEAVATPGISIIDFYADWCGPCTQMEPALQQIEKEGIASIIKVNIDENRELAARFGIKSILTIFLTKDGDVVDIKVGSQSTNSLRNWIETKT